MIVVTKVVNSTRSLFYGYLYILLQCFILCAYIVHLCMFFISPVYSLLGPSKSLLILMNFTLFLFFFDAVLPISCSHSYLSQDSLGQSHHLYVVKYQRLSRQQKQPSSSMQLVNYEFCEWMNQLGREGVICSFRLTFGMHSALWR